MTDRARYRQRISDELHIRSRQRQLTGSAAAADTFELIERELDINGVVLDADERSSLLWLCGGEINTLANIVALIIKPGEHY